MVSCTDDYILVHSIKGLVEAKTTLGDEDLISSAYSLVTVSVGVLLLRLVHNMTLALRVS